MLAMPTPQPDAGRQQRLGAAEVGEAGGGGERAGERTTTVADGPVFVNRRVARCRAGSATDGASRERSACGAEATAGAPEGHLHVCVRGIGCFQARRAWLRGVTGRGPG